MADQSEKEPTPTPEEIAPEEPAPAEGESALLDGEEPKKEAENEPEEKEEEELEIGVLQFEVEDFFFQGEVIKGTSTLHGAGTLVSKTELTKYVGQFAHGLKHGDG